MKNKSLKILYLGNNLSQKSKYETTNVVLSNHLKNEDYEVLLYSNKTNKVLRLLEMIFQLLKNSRHINFVLIDTYSTYNFYYAFVTSQISRFLKIPYIPILHGGNLPHRLDSSQKLSKLIFENAHKNIAPSKYLASEFLKRGYDVQVIPNILDVKNYKLKKRAVISPKLLYVRAFAAIYNPKMAIHVLFELKKKYPLATLCMVGPDRDGSLAGVKKLVSKLGLESSVEFTGVLSKTEWHKKSEEFDVFINTTNFDNTPVSVMEVMAMGLAVVSTNAGGLPYLLDDENDALLVSKNDVNGMVNSVIKLLESNELVEKMTKNAREKVEKFDWYYVKHDWNKILRDENL